MEKRKELILQGLDCANCAAKIETAVCRLEGVKEANINLMTQTLTIEVEEKNEMKKIVEEASKIVVHFEPHVVVSEKQKANAEHTHEGSSFKKVALQLGIGALLLMAAVLVKEPVWGKWSLFLLSYALVGGEVVWKAVKNILRGQVFDENFLMTLSTIGAFAIGEYPEAVAVMLFYQIGEAFQDHAVGHSRKSIRALLNIRPDYANLRTGDMLQRVDPETVKVGDWVVVKPGEKVPLDGKVIEGKALIDASALTGESVPRTVMPEDVILSGMINTNGLLTIEVTKTFGESTVSKILDLVQNASAKKAPTESFITKFARYYTPAVVIGALILAFVPPMLLPQAHFSDWIYRALIFLVISCPCALVVSIPLSFFGGIGAASKNGILIKGGNYLEALNDVHTVVFDKTGTLTKGVFKVSEIYAEDAYTKEQVLKYAALAEVHSNHPIAKSILQEYGEDVALEQIQAYEELPGYGVVVSVEDRKIVVGNSKLMQQHGISHEEQNMPGTLVYVAVDEEYVGCILISDEIKQDAKASVKELRRLGVQSLIMLTGDQQTIGKAVGEELQLDAVYAELLPHQKVEKVEEISQQIPKNKKLIFVGDGINDAPVLTRADIGVAMGGLGSDAAIEAADVVLMTDEPAKLVSAIRIANKTRKIVWQNIVFALGVKGFFLLLGAFGIATMWEAVFADVGVALIAVLNASRVGKGNA